MKKAYKLIPSLKDNLWGGNKLRGYGKETDALILKKLAKAVFFDSDTKEFEPVVNIRRNILFHDLYTDMLSGADADGFIKEKLSTMY